LTDVAWNVELLLLELLLLILLVHLVLKAHVLLRLTLWLDDGLVVHLIHLLLELASLCLLILLLKDWVLLVELWLLIFRFDFWLRSCIVSWDSDILVIDSFIAINLKQFLLYLLRLSTKIDWILSFLPISWNSCHHNLYSSQTVWLGTIISFAFILISRLSLLLVFLQNGQRIW